MPSTNAKLGLLAFGLVGGATAVLLIGLGVLLLARDKPKPPENRPTAHDAVAKTKTPVAEKPAGPVSVPGVETGELGSVITVHGKIDSFAPGTDAFFDAAKDAGERLKDPNYVPPKRPITEFYIFVTSPVSSGKIGLVRCLVVKERNDLERANGMKVGDLVGIRGKIIDYQSYQLLHDLFLADCQIVKWPAGR